MLKPEQIPDEVVEAAARAAWKLKDQRLWEILKATQPNWRDEAREALAAAINAWPGAVWRESGVGREIVSRRIVLPLPPEKETSE